MSRAALPPQGARREPSPPRRTSAEFTHCLHRAPRRASCSAHPLLGDRGTGPGQRQHHPGARSRSTRSRCSKPPAQARRTDPPSRAPATRPPRVGEASRCSARSGPEASREPSRRRTRAGGGRRAAGSRPWAGSGCVDDDAGTSEVNLQAAHAGSISVRPDRSGRCSGTSGRCSSLTALSARGSPDLPDGDGRCWQLRAERISHSPGSRGRRDLLHTFCTRSSERAPDDRGPMTCCPRSPGPSCGWS